MIDYPPHNEVAAPITIVPKPNLIIRRTGVFRLSAGTVIDAQGDALAEAQLLADTLSAATGFPLALKRSEQDKSVIALRIDSEMQSREGYVLDISTGRVQITAQTTTGLFYGIQSLFQLLPASLFSQGKDAQGPWVLPCIEIRDAPRFAWRGAMLDVSRHFMPLSFLYKFVDLLALHKLNVLHLHLNDDQGWRIEIKKFPKLTTVGAYRRESLVGHLLNDASGDDFDPESDQFDSTPHGGFYTQDEARALVAYASARHITIVPEIEMPGHARAAIAAYPELGCTGDEVDVTGRWGVNTDLFNASESTLRFLQDVLAEVMEIFPSTYIHIGGDEAVKNQWKASSAVQARIRQLGLKNEEELQSYFIRRMDEFLTASGRRLIGWDEILEGGLAPNAVVMSWRGESGGVAAAADGHDVVMAPYQYTYFDYYQSADWTREPLAFRETLPLPVVYNYEPVPAQLPPQYAKHILGAQAQLWTEYMTTTAQVEYQAFPRLCALAEIVWSRKDQKNYDEFIQRLTVHLDRLRFRDVNFRPLDFS